MTLAGLESGSDAAEADMRKIMEQLEECAASTPREPRAEDIRGEGGSTGEMD